MEQTKRGIGIPKQGKSMIMIGNVMCFLYVIGILSIYIWREPLVYLLSNSLDGRNAQISLGDKLQIGMLIIVNGYARWLMIRQRTQKLTSDGCRCSLWSIVGIFIGVILLQYPINYIQTYLIARMGSEAIALSSVISSYVGFIGWMSTVSWVFLMIGFGIGYGWLVGESSKQSS